MVLRGEHKIAGIPVTIDDAEDFNNYVGGCDVMPIQHNGSPFTWRNSRVGVECIFERLDRIFSNSDFQGIFSISGGALA